MTDTSDMTDLTADRLREVLDYDPRTGVFYWRYASSSRTPKGSIAGHECKRSRTPYIMIGIDRKVYFAHRLAWLYMHGEWPDGHIDHIDRNPTNNRITNLRVATNSQNHANVGPRCNNTSGIKGVVKQPDCNRWCARITVQGKRIHLGLYETKDEAAKAYQDACQAYFGEFAA